MSVSDGKEQAVTTVREREREVQTTCGALITHFATPHGIPYSTWNLFQSSSSDWNPEMESEMAGAV